jgi:transposase-like protein
MMQDAVLRLRCQEKIWDAFSAAGRRYVKRLLELFMEHERTLFLGCAHRERTHHRRGYRNGFSRRRFQTRWGEIKVRKPKVRGTDEPFRPLALRTYRRREPALEEAVRGWVARGHSTREVTETLSEVFSVALSPTTVSRIVAQVDQEIERFHSRSLEHGYRYVWFDAKHGYLCHKRKRRGRGKKKGAVLLLAWGRRHNGTEELIDFRVAPGEDAESWTAFMTDLERRGLRPKNRWGQRLEMIVSDGDQGLLSGLYMVYPNVPKQRCIFHKVQNIADHLAEAANRKKILPEAGRIYQGLRTRRGGRRRLKKWVERWGELEPEAVKNFCYDFERTLTYLNAPRGLRRRLKTSDPIERFIRELNRKFKEVGIFLFPGARSRERCTWLEWKKLEAAGYAPTRPPDPRDLSTPDS